MNAGHAALQQADYVAHVRRRRVCGSWQCDREAGVPSQQRLDISVALDRPLFGFAKHQFAMRLRSAVRWDVERERPSWRPSAWSERWISTRVAPSERPSTWLI